MTRILLTGSSGFAGHHFLEHALATTDWDIVATASFRHRGTCDRISQVLHGPPALNSSSTDYRPWCDRVEVLTHDLTAPFSPVEQAAIAGREGLDYIVAMASMSHVDTSITDPVAFTENNTAVILHTLELARQLRPKAVVVISTDEVYGPLKGPRAPEAAAGIRQEHREWSPILPSNPYAASKAAQEAVAIAYWRTYGVPVIITNTMNLIGERQHPEKFIPKTLRAVLDGTEAVIHGSPGEPGTRHYLHARNMADAVIWLLRSTRPSAFSAHARETGAAIADRPDRYNIASPDRIDNLTLAAMIAEAAGSRDLHWRWEDFHTTRPGHDPHYGLDSGKITALGWKPPVPFAESLERTVRWTMAHPEWLAS
jgi:dTDP-glucose 4,6-dehydratase